VRDRLCRKARTPSYFQAWQFYWKSLCVCVYVCVCVKECEFEYVKCIRVYAHTHTIKHTHTIILHTASLHAPLAMSLYFLNRYPHLWAIVRVRSTTCPKPAFISVQLTSCDWVCVSECVFMCVNDIEIEYACVICSCTYTLTRTQSQVHTHTHTHAHAHTLIYTRTCSFPRRNPLIVAKWPS
jgi:hypothetical protein